MRRVALFTIQCIRNPIYDYNSTSTFLNEDHTPDSDVEQFSCQSRKAISLEFYDDLLDSF